MQKQHKRVIFITESFRDSVLRDLASTAFAVLVIGIGVGLHSDAMQWAGFFLTGLILMKGAQWMRSENPERTPQEAADFLRDEYGVTAAPKEKQ